jgi:Cu-Zn family superoxide dismutase
MKHIATLGTLLLLTAGIVFAAPKGNSARAELRNAEGRTAGSAMLKQVKSGVQISLSVSNLPAGTHAFHIHAVGKCDAPDFKTAWGHFNPDGKKHGLKNPEGPHAGDMPNIIVATNGRGKAKIVNARATLGEGANSLFHEGGTALVIHEKADDDMTDPAGNAGNRIACGVIEKVQ